jgi:hypothetical protein
MNKTVDINKCLAGGAILEARHNKPIGRLYSWLLGAMLLAGLAVLFFCSYIVLAAR